MVYDLNLDSKRNELVFSLARFEESLKKRGKKRKKNLRYGVGG